MTRFRGKAYINQRARISLGEAKLEDFLTEGEFAAALQDARWRVIRIFADARTGPKRYATPGCIRGLNGKVASLAAYISRTMTEYSKAKIFSAENLPREYQLGNRRLSSHERKSFLREQAAIVGFVREELFIRLLTCMRDTNDLWYVNCEWTVRQSVLDEVGLLFKAAKQSYYDDRNWHGRPRRDRRNGTLEAVSVGYCA